MAKLPPELDPNKADFPVTQDFGQLSGNGFFGVLAKSGDLHDSAEVLVQYGPTVAAGIVHVYRETQSDRFGPVRARVGQVAFDARGGVLLFRYAQGDGGFRAEVAGYAGAGPITATIKTWRDNGGVRVTHKLG